MVRAARRAASVVVVAIVCQFGAGCLPGGLSPAQLYRLRQCEASGSYTAVSPGGTYRGAYQFDRVTWRSMGGSGDPAAAPAWEQDTRASLLYQARGGSPWPLCRRVL